jgi:hypothetical protein
MSGVLWSPLAVNDLMQIENLVIVHGLLSMAENGLHFPPREPCPEDWVQGRTGQLAWRCAITPLGRPSVHDEMCDYYIVYRQATDEERREVGGHNGTLWIARVLHVEDFVLSGI